MTDPDIVHEIGLDAFLDQLCVEISRDVSDLDIVCFCQGRPSRPMMCLISRSAALRMFSTTVVRCY